MAGGSVPTAPVGIASTICWRASDKVNRVLSEKLQDHTFPVQAIVDLCASLQTSNRGKILQILHAYHSLFYAENTLLPSSNFDESLLQSLDRLLEKGAFLRTDETNFRRLNIFSRKQKATLALKLAHCLSGFLYSEAIQPSWDGKKVFILNRQGTADPAGSVLYVSFTRARSDHKTQPLIHGIGFAHPVLLSFAKLLLELDSGERIDLSEYQDHSTSQWGALSERAWKTEVSGSRLYAEAVKGCLNLHMHYYHVRVSSDEEDPRVVLRQTIEEQIVKHLEKVANPPTAASRKRRLEDLDDQDPKGRRLWKASPPSPQTMK